MKQLSNPDSPFNPEYKKEKKFYRKENKKKLFIVFIVSISLLYGTIDYMNQNLTKIQMKTIAGVKVTNPLFINGECNLFIKNMSPYNVKLIVPDGIETNYNNSILRVGVEYYFWFRTSPNLSRGGSAPELQIRGVKS